MTFEPRGTEHGRIEAARWLDELAALLPGMDRGLIANAHSWLADRRDLLVGDAPVLVHADLHPSNVMVDGTQISGLIDFEVARAQPADAELHRLLGWCAAPQHFGPVPGAPGLDALSLREVPSWLRDAYAQPFAVPNLRERLHVYEMQWELAQLHRMVTLESMAAAQDRIVPCSVATLGQTKRTGDRSCSRSADRPMSTERARRNDRRIRTQRAAPA